ncbi:MAG TPA: PEGA domain-containing protein, partial [Anaeromyxobacteraceae bacterium]|nr:PEGA domain-containing protein [Anaeromyxobacteraceae bacterium]
LVRPVPAEPWGDPSRRAQLERDLSRAGDIEHPHVARPMGLEESGGGAATIEAWVEGERLSEVLAIGGRMPPVVAARIVADACAGVHFAHEGAGDGSLVHGHLRPEALLVSRSGSTLVCGFGRAALEGARPLRERLPWVSPEQLLGGPGAADRQSDVFLLGLVLHACLSGEAPFAGEPDVEEAVLDGRPAPLEPLGVPRALAEVVERATARKASERHASAAEMGRAVERAVEELAPPSAVAAWLDVLLPVEEGTRAERRKLLDGATSGRPPSAGGEGPAKTDAAPAPPAALEIGDEHIVGALTPAPLSPPLPPPSLMRTADIVVDAGSPPAQLRRTADIVPAPAPGPDLVTTREIVGEGSAPFMVARPPAPPPEPARRDRATATLAVGIAVAGLAIGFGLARRGGETPPPAPSPAAVAPVAPAPAPAEAPAPSAAPVPAPRVEPPRREPPAPPSIEVAADPAGDIYVDGKRAGRAPLTRAVSRGRHKVRLVDKASGVDVTKVVEVRGPRTPVRFALGKGTLTVTAPEGAAIFLDGRRVGTGGVVDLAVYQGSHHITVRLGQARNDHDFRIGPGETYSYDVEKTGP